MLKTLTILVVPLLLVGCSGGEGGSSSADITMSDALDFEPEEFTAQVGDTIVFENTSSQSHTVTAYQDEIPEGADYFASGGASSEQEASEDIAGGLLQEGDTFEVTLEEPGTYRYFCIPHESSGMIGTITVTNP